VPTYIVEGEKFFGREHLPRIRWMLNGRPGAPPDIAYTEFSVERSAANDIVKGHLPVAIDFKSPQAYLSVAPTCALADELGITIDWQPLNVPPTKVASAPAGDDRGSRHRRFRADYLDHDVARYAADRGLVISGLDRRKDSTLASIGLLWAQRQSPALARAYVERVFARFGKAELDIEDAREISALLTGIGAAVSGFDAFSKDEGRDELARIQSELRERGVFEVPTYIFNDDVFLGRQHLPLIRARLST